jgi:hypothetical protein
MDLLLDIDISQRDNKNGDAKGGKRANTSADAGHRHGKTRKDLKTKGVEKQKTLVLQLEVRLAGEH